MQRILPFLPLLLCLSAAPTTLPQSDANFWLDRAGREIFAMAAQNDEVKPFGSIDLSIALVQSRGSEPDRKILSGVLKQEYPTAIPTTAKQKSETAGRLLESAAACAVLGDKQLMDACLQEAASLRKGDQSLYGKFAGLGVAQVYCLAGDVESAKAAAFKSRAPLVDSDEFAAAMLIRYFRDANLQDAQNAMLLWETKNAMSKPGTDDQAFALQQVVALQIEIGDCNGARATASAMPVSFERSKSYLSLAAKFAEIGDRKSTQESLLSAAATIDQLSDLDRRQFYAEIAETAAELGEKDIATRACASLEKAMQEYPQWASAYWPRLAYFRASIGDKDAYHHACEMSLAEIDKITEAKDKADQLMQLTAAYARAGDNRLADQAFRRATQIHPDDDYASSNYFGPIPYAYSQAGDYAAAKALLKTAIPDPVQAAIFYYSIAKVQARAGKFDDAKQTADAIPQSPPAARLWRLHAYFQIALAQTTAGDPAAAARWIDALPTPAERAILDLAVAQKMLGREGRGIMHILYR